MGGRRRTGFCRVGADELGAPAVTRTAVGPRDYGADGFVWGSDLPGSRGVAGSTALDPGTHYSIRFPGDSVSPLARASPAGGRCCEPHCAMQSDPRKGGHLHRGRLRLFVEVTNRIEPHPDSCNPPQDLFSP